ncbi:MAG: ribonuclease Z [Flavobacteriaceae bacterium]|jgi:ribonuclease Z|nr:ribonuclease Z [Flavobacteriaceae bacterium]MBT4313305.1 ribonuclease Z [Flavobacteriaceae bacterium]MBT5091316.1 ribonuclease Z [Flavobacteriaceae bacterium]MBT5284173.1 ribonuclease Z [Flavobacteriaceae bacterium]MBT5445829.1 ribonuclease Z [Flavobacteriaceae bacterium]
MKLTILGCHSATPRENKHTTSQLLEVGGNLFLIDCGEGTQIQLRKIKVKFSRIQHIFISHLHGDHFYGLIGLISTFRLLGRTAMLHIYGPKGIKEIITLQLKLAKSWTDYPLHFHELEQDSSQVVFEDETVRVETLPLDHRIYTNGFLFTTQASKRKMNVDAIKDFDLLPFHFKQLQQGADVTLEDGRILENEVYTLPPSKSKKYAYCSDTAYFEPLVPGIKEVDLLYHEATFLEKNSDLAANTKHSTAKQAAQIAKMANVKQLMLGHFSNRYPNKEDFITEASDTFQNVILAEDLKTFNI